MKQNVDIRRAITNAGLKQWQVADVYGLHEGNFSRLLRKELPSEEKQKIHNIIGQIKNQNAEKIKSKGCENIDQT